MIKGRKHSPELISSQLHVLQERIDELKRKRPRALTAEQRIDILMVYHRLQIEDLEDQKKHPERKKRKGDYQNRVSKLLGYGKQSISDTYRDWRDGCQVHSALPPANRNKKEERIPRRRFVLHAVRDCIREARAEKKRIVARHIWDVMRQRGWLVVDDKDPKAVASSLRTVRRYLERRGFQRGENTSSPVREKKEVIEARGFYLKHLVDNSSLPPDQQLRIVDLDESYIHHHYKRHDDDSLYHPGDKETPNPRTVHKGQRYCFIAAIQAADPRQRSTISIHSPEDRAGLVPNSVWIFKSKKGTDYHSSFISMVSTLLNGSKKAFSRI